MNLIIASNEDSASINLRDRLLEMSEWSTDGEFDNNTLCPITKLVFGSTIGSKERKPKRFCILL